MAPEPADGGTAEKDVPPSTYVLCAGVDAESADRGFKGLSFRVMAADRSKQIMDTLRRDQNAQIIIFDFLAGTKETTAITWKGGRATAETTVVEKPFTPVVREFFKPRRVKDELGGWHTYYDFISGQRGVMSIADVYKAIQDIGRNAPGTVCELSFLAHADHNGPSFLNSWEDWEGTGVGAATIAIMRDPDDKDGRAAKDFRYPNMTDEQLGAFTKAFNEKGYLWIWGCNFPDDIHRLLDRVERSGRSLLRDDTRIAVEHLKTS